MNKPGATTENPGGYASGQSSHLRFGAATLQWIFYLIVAVAGAIYAHKAFWGMDRFQDDYSPTHSTVWGIGSLFICLGFFILAIRVMVAGTIQDEIRDLAITVGTTKTGAEMLQMDERRIRGGCAQLRRLVRELNDNNRRYHLANLFSLALMADIDSSGSITLGEFKAMKQFMEKNFNIDRRDVETTMDVLRVHGLVPVQSFHRSWMKELFLRLGIQKDSDSSTLEDPKTPLEGHDGTLISLQHKANQLGNEMGIINRASSLGRRSSARAKKEFSRERSGTISALFVNDHDIDASDDAERMMQHISIIHWGDALPPRRPTNSPSDVTQDQTGRKSRANGNKCFVLSVEDVLQEHFKEESLPSGKMLVNLNPEDKKKSFSIAYELNRAEMVEIVHLEVTRHKSGYVKSVDDVSMTGAAERHDDDEKLNPKKTIRRLRQSIHKWPDTKVKKYAELLRNFLHPTKFIELMDEKDDINASKAENIYNVVPLASVESLEAANLILDLDSKKPSAWSTKQFRRILIQTLELVEEDLEFSVTMQLDDFVTKVQNLETSSIGARDGD